MIGDSSMYEMLYSLDDDFKKIFKIKADFDVEMPNNEKSIGSYLSFVRSLCDHENLLPFAVDAVAEIVEYGVRLAGRKNKLSTRFSVLADVIREASYWAAKANAKAATSEHVRKAIEERIDRVRWWRKKSRR